jgi:hypothetical protein
VPSTTDRIIGVAVILFIAALTWYAVGLAKALLLWLSIFMLYALVLYLLGRNSKLARAGAVLLLPNTIFLIFLPKRVRSQIEELRSREQQRS